MRTSLLTTSFTEYDAGRAKIVGELFECRGQLQKKNSSTFTTEMKALQLGQAAIHLTNMIGGVDESSLTAGQKSDAPQAEALLDARRAEIIMAYAAYDSDRLRQTITEKEAIAVSSNNPAWACRRWLDKRLDAQRHLVESCFAKLKQFRRVATR